MGERNNSIELEFNKAVDIFLSLIFLDRHALLFEYQDNIYIRLVMINYFNFRNQGVHDGGELSTRSMTDGLRDVVDLSTVVGAVSTALLACNSPNNYYYDYNNNDCNKN